jgi:hypothetical protein
MAAVSSSLTHLVHFSEVVVLFAQVSKKLLAGVGESAFGARSPLVLKVVGVMVIVMVVGD